MRSRADTSFGRPTSFVPCRIWRWRLVTSTRSKSTRPSVPTPAAARYRAAGDPSPPAPTSSTRARRSARCPSTPISGRIRWRLYLRYSSGARSGSVAVVMSSSGDGGHDRQFIGRLQRRVEPADEADVLVIEVDGHERIRRAVFVAEPRRQGGEAAGDVTDHFTDGVAGGVDGMLAPGERGQDGGKAYQWHG